MRLKCKFCEATFARLIEWKDEPAPSRKGWILTTCRECGKFIGYRETDKKK